jgi:hypothetical protein
LQHPPQIAISFEAMSEGEGIRAKNNLTNGRWQGNSD